MRRGDFVTVAIQSDYGKQGDYGKPRPALVIQAELFNEHASVTVPPVTSTSIQRCSIHHQAHNIMTKRRRHRLSRASYH